MLQAHRDGHHALHACLYLDKILVVGGECTHETRCNGKGSGQAVYPTYDPLQAGIIVCKDVCLRAEVAQRVSQQSSALAHLLIGRRALLAIETHLCEGVLQLSQLCGQLLSRSFVFFVLCLQGGKRNFFLFERLTTSVNLCLHFRPLFARDGLFQLPLQLLQVFFYSIDLLPLLLDTVGNGLVGLIDPIREGIGRFSCLVHAGRQLVAHEKLNFYGLDGHFDSVFGRTLPASFFVCSLPCVLAH